MVKNLLSNAADVDSIPGWGTKIPRDSAKTSLVAQMVKASACSVGDLGLIPGLGRSPGGGHGNPFQYSCLENPHGQRSLEGYSPWGHRAQHTAERLSIAQDRI